MTPTPRVGEAWQTARGVAVVVVHTGDPKLYRRARIIRFTVDGLERTCTLANFLRVYKPSAPRPVAPAEPVLVWGRPVAELVANATELGRREAARLSKERRFRCAGYALLRSAGMSPAQVLAELDAPVGTGVA